MSEGGGGVSHGLGGGRQELGDGRRGARAGRCWKLLRGWGWCGANAAPGARRLLTGPGRPPGSAAGGVGRCAAAAGARRTGRRSAACPGVCVSVSPLPGRGWSVSPRARAGKWRPSRGGGASRVIVRRVGKAGGCEGNPRRGSRA